MHSQVPDVEWRLATLERSLRRTRLLAGGLAVCVGGLALVGFAGQPQTAPELRTRRLVVVDDSGVVRAVLGQDSAATQRRSRSAGLLVFDRTGQERGGFTTMDDGSVVLALDAPRGVGAAMPDRIGLVVAPDGAADVRLLDNQTRAVARLQSDGRGGGGVQVFKWDLPRHQVHVRTETYNGSLRDSVRLDH